VISETKPELVRFPHFCLLLYACLLAAACCLVPPLLLRLVLRKQKPN
jgi:hypothetical protein